MNGQATAEGRVVDCTVLSSGFPAALPSEISRDGVLNGIEEFFSSGVQLVTLEGKQDVGKTRIVAQFAQRHRNCCISLFVTPHCWFLHDPSLLFADLAAQMSWAATRSELPSNSESDERSIRRLSLEMQRVGRRTGQTFYFAIDGLEELSDDAGQLCAALVSILPFEYSCFRFLVTGNDHWFPTSAKLSRKNYPISGFTIEETVAYFGGNALSRAQAEELYRNCSRGTPGHLASAKRLLESGMPVAELLEHFPEQLPNPFKLEWQKIQQGDQSLLLALAILAFDSTPHPLAELASLVKSGADDLRAKFQRLGFIDLGNDESSVSYVTNSFRRFATEQLIASRESAWERLVTHFLEHQESDRSLEVLPTYLEKTNRSQELLTVLTPRTFVSFIERTDSFEPLRHRSQVGLTTALKLNRPADAVRFGVQTSAVADITSLEVARAEVIARLAIDDYPAALTLAQGAALKHQRLQLLAAIAKYQRERGLTPEPVVLDAIEQLVNQIDLRELRDKLVELASDLMYSRPDLAIRVIAGAGPTTSDDRSMDWALVRLSALAELSRDDNQGMGLHTAADDLRSKIADPVARRFSNAIALVVGNYTVNEVLQHVEDLDSAGDQLYLLRQWCIRTKRAKEASSIVDYAVHLAIRTTEYTPTARDFRDLAVPLPYIEDAQKLNTLITAFDIHRESAKQTGPIQDFVQLQMLIAEAENRLSPRRAGQRLLETYYEVNNLPELEIRTVCKGLIAAAVDQIDPTGAFEDSRDVKTLVQEEFEAESQAILRDTADHYEVTRAIIQAVGVSKPSLALSLIHSMNVESRRDDALKDLVRYLLELPGKKIPVEFLRTIIGQFADPDEEDTAVSEVLQRIARFTSKPLLQDIALHLRVFISRACDIVDPCAACDALTAATVVLSKLGDPTLNTLQTAVINRLRACWISIDDPGVKLEAGYKIVIGLADYQRELAISYLSGADDVKHSHHDLTGSTYLACLRLAIRTYSGLLPGNLENSADFERLAIQIDRVPSRMYRVYLWSDLALRCFRHDRSEDAKKIVVQKIRPLLDKLSDESPYEWRNATVWAAPAMWESTPEAAADYILRLPLHWRDIAYERVLRFRLTRVPPSDPYWFSADASHHLDHDRCVEILKIAEHEDIDSAVYKYIEAVAKSAVWRHNRLAPSQTQKSELAQLIRDLSAKKFPNPRFIRHDGYAILAAGQATRLMREKAADWQPLVARARSLCNAADRAFVLTYLAEMMHTGLALERNKLIREAKDVADKIPALLDRVYRYRLIARVAFDLDHAFARQVFREAMALTANKGAEGCEEARRQIVDSAYQLDADLAASLASSLDDDEARKSARRRLEYQKAQKKLLESPVQPESTLDPETTSRVFWDLLGKLNAGRVAPRDVSQSLGIVGIAGNYPLRFSFPILSWAVENAIIKRGHADEAKRLLREMYEGMLSSAEIAAAVVSRALGIDAPRVVDTSVSDSERVIVAAGQRERGLEFIRSWLRRCASEYLWICDPYFGPQDLEALQLVLECKPSLQVTVVTSRKQQEHEKLDWPWDIAYARYWKKNFSDQEPPRTEFVVVGTKTGDLPIHDRWWLTKGYGIRLGTSFNGLGRSRDSEVSILTDSETRDRETQTQAFMTRDRREHLGERLSYQFFEM